MTKFIITFIFYFPLNIFLFSQTISAGHYHSVFICKDKSAMSSGYDCDGRKGLGNRTAYYVPGPVTSIDSVQSTSAGGYHTLFIGVDGTAWATGSNESGQLGLGLYPGTSFPTKIEILSDIIAISAGQSHSLFLKGDGTVWSCGQNNSGQLGDGLRANRSIPSQIPSLSGIIGISAGFNHSLFLKNDGTVWVCGGVDHGQSFHPYDPVTADIPVQVPAIEHVKIISAGPYYSLFVKEDGTAWSLGSNGGQLGDPLRNHHSSPYHISSMTDVISISAGIENSLFLKSDSTVWCAGRGSCGDGTWNLNLTPVKVSGITGVVEISCGNGFSLLKKADRTVWGFGSSSNGELSGGMPTGSNVPIKITGLCGDPLPITPPSTADVEKNSREIEISVCPNPVTEGSFIINYPASADAYDFTIYDLSGHEVYNTTSVSGSNMEVNTSGFRKGFYILKIQQPGSVGIKKISVL